MVPHMLLPARSEGTGSRHRPRSRALDHSTRCALTRLSVAIRIQRTACHAETSSPGSPDCCGRPTGPAESRWMMQRVLHRPQHVWRRSTPSEGQRDGRQSGQPHRAQAPRRSLGARVRCLAPACRGRRRGRSRRHHGRATHVGCGGTGAGRHTTPVDRRWGAACRTAGGERGGRPHLLRPVRQRGGRSGPGRRARRDHRRPGPALPGHGRRPRPRGPDDPRVRSPPRVPGHRRGGQLVDGSADGPAGADARGRGDLLGNSSRAARAR